MSQRTHQHVLHYTFPSFFRVLTVVGLEHTGYLTKHSGRNSGIDRVNSL